MINGIPYWGKETFLKMRELQERTPIKRTVSELGCDSLYSLFMYLAKENMVIRVKDGERYFYTYARDICFNYRDRVIFAPYYHYVEKSILYSGDKTKHLDFIGDMVSLKCEFAKHIYEVDNRQTKQRLPYLEVYDSTSDELLSIGLKDIPYITEIFSLDKLYLFYVNSLYYYFDEANIEYDMENRYHRIDKEQGNNFEYILRNVFGFRHYVKGMEDYSIVDYRDVRMFKFEELKSKVKILFDTSRLYWERKLLFEGYMYCCFAANLVPCEDAMRSKFYNLGVTERVIRYGDDTLPLFLKYYYKDDITLRKKSYEKYLILT